MPIFSFEDCATIHNKVWTNYCYNKRVAFCQLAIVIVAVGGMSAPVVPCPMYIS